MQSQLNLDDFLPLITSSVGRLQGLPPLGLRACPGLRPRASSFALCSASRRAFASQIAASRSSRRLSSCGS